MKVGPKGIALIKEFEGLYLKAYLCSSGVPTIGWGTTIYPNGKKVRLGDTCSEAQAEEYLRFDIDNKYARYVNESVCAQHIETQEQFDALCSFVYNVGKGGVSAPNTIDRRLRAGENFAVVIREELPRWNRGGGRVLAGLVRRREAELDLFFSTSGGRGVLMKWLKIVPIIVDVVLQVWDLVKRKKK